MQNILLIDDHQIVRSGLKSLFDTNTNINTIGEFNNGQEALDFIDKGGEADVILTDINMPIMDGFTLISELKKRKSKVKTIILSMLDNEQSVKQAFCAGANGYLLKTVDEKELEFALSTIKQGRKYLCNELVEKFLIQFVQPIEISDEDKLSGIEFSEREMEVLHLISEGFTNFQMSEKLFLSKRTIEGHRQALLDKTGAKNTAMLIKLSVLNGFL